MFRRKEDFPEGKQEDTRNPFSATPFNRSTAAEVEDVTPVPPTETRTPSEPVVENRPTFDAVRRYPERPSYRAPESPAREVSPPVRRPEETRTPNVPSPRAPEKSDKPAKRVLTVGQDTVLKGEISSSDKVLVEGGVEARLWDVQSLEILESGMFLGSAIVDEAEISGRFDGDLTVKGKLVVYASGRISGKIRYTEIEIHRGGRISGDVGMFEDSAIPSFEVMGDEDDSHRTRRKGSKPSQKLDEEERPNSISELFAS
jgi:cytoskeletal protein CcmA (bactofilin family)